MLKERQVVVPVSILNRDFIKPCSIQLISQSDIDVLIGLLVVLLILRKQQIHATS